MLAFVVAVVLAIVGVVAAWVIRVVKRRVF